MIDDKARPCSAGLFDALALEIADFNFLLLSSGRVPGSEGSGFLEHSVREIVHFLSPRTEDDVRAGDVLGVEPDIGRRAEAESEFLVLQIVLADIEVIAVGAPVMERLAGRNPLLFGRCLRAPAGSVRDHLPR